MKYLLFINLLIANFIFAEYYDHPESQKIIKELVEVHNFDPNYVERVLKDARKQQKIIDSISKPAEFTWTWDRYKKLFIEDKRIKNGKNFIQNNIKTLEKAEAEFGVPKEIIVAIMGIETRYGRIMGNYRVIDSLTNQICH